MSNQMKDSCVSAQALNSYLIERAKRHEHFKLYTTDENLNEILVSGSLRLTDGSTWNDKEDAGSFNSDRSKKCYALCFSFSESENVAMWMLYGGRKKTGRMINFTQHDIMQKLIANIKECYDRDGHVYAVDQNQITLTDVAYYGHRNPEDSNYSVKRSNELVENVSFEIIDPLSINKKAYPWSYENESRLVISFCDEYGVMQDIHEIFVKLPKSLQKEIKNRVRVAPNSSDSRYSPSVLRGSIDWNLCKDCSNSEE